MSKVLGFTGSRSFRRDDLRLITPQMWDFFEGFGTHVTGGCRGFDAVLGWQLAEEYPMKRHVVVLPADRSQVDAWWERTATQVDVVEMPAGSDYRDRNAEIVNRSDVLFYCANRPEHRDVRSGTWMTVRLARGLKTIRVVGMILESERV